MELKGAKRSPPLPFPTVPSALAPLPLGGILLPPITSARACCARAASSTSFQMPRPMAALCGEVVGLEREVLPAPQLGLPPSQAGWMMVCSSWAEERHQSWERQGACCWMLLWELGGGQLSAGQGRAPSARQPPLRTMGLYVQRHKMGRNAKACLGLRVQKDRVLWRGGGLQCGYGAFLSSRKPTVLLFGV